MPQRNEEVVELWKTLATGWEIDMTQNPPVLTFDREGQKLSTVPLQEEVLNELVPALNRVSVPEQEFATYWEIRRPELADDSDPLPPVLTLMRSNTIMASLPLTEELLDKLVPVLNAVHTPKIPESKLFRARIARWVKRHPRWSILFAILLSPLAAFILYEIVIQFVLFFAGIFA